MPISRDRDMLSCTKVRSSPASAILRAFHVSTKKPRASAKRRGFRIFTSGIAVGVISSTAFSQMERQTAPPIGGGTSCAKSLRA